MYIQQVLITQIMVAQLTVSISQFAKSPERLLPPPLGRLFSKEDPLPLSTAFAVT